MKIVLYGAGYRGEKIGKYFGKDYVIAYIDADKEKQGQKINDIPIISIEDYLAKYIDYYVVITPAYNPEIKEMLNNYGIYHCEDSKKLPTDVLERGDFPLIIYDNVIKQNSKMLLYGINAFSIWLQERAKKLFGKEIKICPEKKCKREVLDWAINHLNIENQSDIANKVVLNTMPIDDEFLVEMKNKKCNLFTYSVDIGYYKNNLLKKIKGLFKGQRCFIVATGPSLTHSDLRKLEIKNEFSFAVNQFYKFDSKFRPNAYVVVDSFLINSSYKAINMVDADYKFIGDGGVNFWNNTENTEEKNLFKIHALQGPPYIEFVEDISYKLCAVGTVTFIALQIAVYMGFSQIYLLGTDCNYKMESKNNHAYEDEIDKKDHNIQNMFMAFEEARKYADSHDIKIYNATRGGMLEVFERVDFDSLFE